MYFNGLPSVFAAFSAFGAFALVAHCSFAIVANVPLRLPDSFFVMHGGEASPTQKPAVEAVDENLGSPTAALTGKGGYSGSYGTESTPNDRGAVETRTFVRRITIWARSEPVRALVTPNAWSVYLSISFALLSMVLHDDYCE